MTFDAVHAPQLNYCLFIALIFVRCYQEISFRRAFHEVFT